MNLLRHLLILIAFLIPLLLNANNDSIQKRFQDNSSFVGHIWGEDSLNVYKGKHTNINFIQAEGYFKIQGEEITPLYARIVNGASDTCFVNCNIWDKCKIYETVSQHKYTLFEITGDTFPLFLKSKYYDYSKNKWYIQTKSDDFIWGYRYDSSLNHIDDLAEDYNIDKYMLYLVFAILVALSLWAILSPISGEKRWQVSPKNSMLFSIILILISLIFLDNWMQLQLFWPLMSFWILFVLIKLYKSNSIRIAILHLGASLFLILGWGYFQFYSLESHIDLSDREMVHIHWRKGTDWTKRLVIKRILSNMVPVPVTDHGTSYTVYASKYEFTIGELAVLNDDIFGWIAYLFHNDALAGLSFREAQIILQKIENISGVKLDFFTYPEWQSASLGIDHACHKNELKSVNIGIPNKFGLVSIADNVPEFTSSYYPTIKLGINADTLIGAVNNVYVAGSAYISDNPMNYSVVNKNLREGNVGLRLVYRPRGIGARKFHIKGYKDKNYLNNDIPSEMLIVSIDNKLITDFANYESFEEYLTEHFYDTKHIEAFNIQTKKVENVIIPPGFGMYDFEPNFIFNGIEEKKSVIIATANGKEGYFAEQGYSGVFVVLEWCEWDCTQSIEAFSGEFEKRKNSKKNIVLLPIENHEGGDIFKDIIRVKCPNGKLGLHIQETMITESYYKNNILNRYKEWE